MKQSLSHFVGMAILGTFVSIASAATIATSSLDGGGKPAASVAYDNVGSLGGIGGISTAPGETAKHGYIGQLTEVISVNVTGTPATVSETATSQLSGSAVLDDASMIALSGTAINWTSPTFPIASIGSNGLATMSAVYQNTTGTFSGQYLGKVGTGQLQVIDTIPDNFGLYAGDAISDAWQVQYFGLNNPKAAPDVDAFGSGQDNLFKYIAGLDPTNPASIFVLTIAAVPGQPAQKNLIFHPIAEGRTYSVEFTTNLTGNLATTLSNLGGPLTNAQQVTVTDLDASQPAKYYHVNISFP